MRKAIFLALFLLTLASGAQTKKNLAPTPPMGWNSWDWFGKAEITEEIMKQCIDAIVDKGLKDAGYEYFVVDGGWRDTKLGPGGELRSHPQKFPSGMKLLADYAHRKGLKFGLHTVPGTHDCGGDSVGGYGNEEIHIRQFLDWGVDFIKLDKCKFSGGWDEKVLQDTYVKWRQMLDASGRDIVLSISAYKWRDWYPAVGEMARTTGDIKARVSKGAIFDRNERRGSVMEIAGINNQWASKAGNGYWNDPDMLAVGNQGLTLEEQKAHFALWCIMSSPLMLGNDPRTMTTEELAVITNKKAISIDQDTREQGKRIKQDGKTEVWAKKLSDGKTALLLLNRDDNNSLDVAVSLSELGVKGKAKATDIWTGTPAGSFKGMVSQKVEPHSAKFFLLH